MKTVGLATGRDQIAAAIAEADASVAALNAAVSAYYAAGILEADAASAALLGELDAHAGQPVAEAHGTVSAAQYSDSGGAAVAPRSLKVTVSGRTLYVPFSKGNIPL